MKVQQFIQQARALPHDASPSTVVAIVAALQTLASCIEIADAPPPPPPIQLVPSPDPAAEPTTTDPTAHNN